MDGDMTLEECIDSVILARFLSVLPPDARAEVLVEFSAGTPVRREERPNSVDIRPGTMTLGNEGGAEWGDLLLYTVGDVQLGLVQRATIDEIRATFEDAAEHGLTPAQFLATMIDAPES